jgi:uncharacterized protein
VWGKQVQVILFSSRVHDSSKGGDIALYLETEHPKLIDTINCKIQLEAQLDIPVDLIVKPHGNTSSIAMIAKKEGIAL